MNIVSECQDMLKTMTYFGKMENSFLFVIWTSVEILLYINHWK